MRIRRRDKDPAETGAPGQPRVAPYDYDEDGSPGADAVTSQSPEPAQAEGSTSPTQPGAGPDPTPVPQAATDADPGTAQAVPVQQVSAPPASEPTHLTTVEPPRGQDSAPTPPPGEPAAPAAATPEAAAPATATPAATVAVPPVPAPAARVREVVETTPSAPKHAMRAPSIGNDATDLLNGSKPVQRELPRIIAIANQKGGVGKTTTTVNLGAALAELDYRVLVIDLDPQGNATTGLGVEARNFELSMYDVIMRDQPLEDCIEPTSVKNLFVAPATIDLAGVEIELVPAFSREMKLKRAIDTVVDDFDFVLIDCPPSLGLITVNGLAAADEVLVPIQCEYYALEGLSQLLRNVNLVSTNLNQTLEVSTIVLTMYDARTRLSVDVANEVREHFSERVCRAVIPRTVRLSEAPSFGQPITVFDPTSRGAVAYRELAKEVSNGAPQRSR
jgi:chromosome partitioning protein